MLDACSYCSKVINKGNSIYFGYDHICCSTLCRMKVAKKVTDKDPRLHNPDKWKTISKKRSTVDLEKLCVNDNPKQEYYIPEIKKTKSYKKEVSELIINENTNQYNYYYDCSCNIIFNTFTTLREYFNFANLTPTGLLDLSMLKTTILLSPSNIFTKLYF